MPKRFHKKVGWPTRVINPNYFCWINKTRCGWSHSIHPSLQAIITWSFENNTWSFEKNKWPWAMSICSIKSPFLTILLRCSPSPPRSGQLGMRRAIQGDFTGRDFLAQLFHLATLKLSFAAWVPPPSLYKIIQDNRCILHIDQYANLKYALTIVSHQTT